MGLRWQLSCSPLNQLVHLAPSSTRNSHEQCAQLRSGGSVEVCRLPCELRFRELCISRSERRGQRREQAPLGIGCGCGLGLGCGCGHRVAAQVAVQDWQLAVCRGLPIQQLLVLELERIKFPRRRSWNSRSARRIDCTATDMSTQRHSLDHKAHHRAGPAR